MNPPPCSHNPDLFFDPAHTADAIAICQTCPHQTPCQHAHDQQPPTQKGYGVWAGNVSKQVPTCNTPDCGRDVRARGLCNRCYYRDHRRRTKTQTAAAP